MKIDVLDPGVDVDITVSTNLLREVGSSQHLQVSYQGKPLVILELTPEQYKDLLKQACDNTRPPWVPQPPQSRVTSEDHYRHFTDAPPESATPPVPEEAPQTVPKMGLLEALAIVPAGTATTTPTPAGGDVGEGGSPEGAEVQDGEEVVQFRRPPFEVEDL